MSATKPASLQLCKIEGLHRAKENLHITIAQSSKSIFTH